MRPQITSTILRKKNKVEGITIPDYQTMLQGHYNQTARYWRKNRHTDQRNRTDPRNQPIFIWSINI